MHPFTPQGKLIYLGLEGFEESEKLIKFAESSSNRLLSPSSARILRPCFTDKAMADWRKAASVHGDWVSEISVEEYTANVGHSLRVEDVPLGVFSLKNVHVIDSPAYLQALWAAIQTHYGESCSIEWSRCMWRALRLRLMGNTTLL